jgi:hypothetical protein
MIDEAIANATALPISIFCLNQDGQDLDASAIGKLPQNDPVIAHPPSKPPLPLRSLERLDVPPSPIISESMPDLWDVVFLKRISRNCFIVGNIPYSSSLNEAIADMVDFYSEQNNRWFTEGYWPANEKRVTRMLLDLVERVPCGGRVFEPGCANGFVSFLAARLGYCVTAADAWCPPDRHSLFSRAGEIQFFTCNMNDDNPWPRLTDGSFDAVLIGEVFEHL